MKDEDFKAAFIVFTMFVLAGVLIVISL